MARTDREPSKRQKTAVAALTAIICVVSYASHGVGSWLMLLALPLAYAVVLVRTW
jgi:hypothetical protein